MSTESKATPVTARKDSLENSLVKNAERLKGVF